MESFFHTLKVEVDLESGEKTRQEVRAELFEYIETFYNRERLHSALGYRTPVEIEALQGKRKLCA